MRTLKKSKSVKSVRPTAKSAGKEPFYSCCTSTVGVVHLIAGIGVGMLMANYLGVANLALWGWAFVAAGTIMHFMK
ncbi:MAG: hypothetical protein AAB823_02660 [Patescibacteria group bacterium]